MWIDVRGQLIRTSFLLPLCVFQVSNSTASDMTENSYIYLLNHFISPYVEEKEMTSSCILHLFSWHFHWLQLVFLTLEGPPCYSGGPYCYAQGNLCYNATEGLALLSNVHVSYTIRDSIIQQYLQRWSSIHYNMYSFKDFN